MYRLLCCALVVGVASVLAGCGPDEAPDDQVLLSLYISNQSVEVSSIRIRVELDDDEVIDADFPAVGPVGGIPQHYWVRHDFLLSQGTHYLTAWAEGADGATLSETLELQSPMYLLLMFDGASTDTGTLVLSVSEDEPRFS